MAEQKQKLQKPFFKWIGGKIQIINDIISKITNEINNYHELFLGGGSVLFAVLSLQKQNKIIIKNKIYAYDINNDLINVIPIWFIIFNNYILYCLNVKLI